MIEKTFSIVEQPIEIGSEPVKATNLFIKIFNFKTYQEIKKVLEDLNDEIELMQQSGKFDEFIEDMKKQCYKFDKAA